MRRADRSQAGFTLIELLVTATVTVIGFAALLGLHFATVGGNALSGRSGEAVAICERTVEQLRSESVGGMIQDLTGSASTALPLNNISMSTVAGRNGMTYRRLVSVRELTAASPDLIQIHVAVDWTDDGAVQGSDNGIHDHEVVLELIRTRQEGL
ncbi:MAG TPA: prepilin-type N-terminal cleavage/methylation domain-containing protein [Kofleriaceae bacterium]|nr:prepilin-type N-terminal cleavage/methylation domain-containing protein [Kofleriaceae bacterium]